MIENRNGKGLIALIMVLLMLAFGCGLPAKPQEALAGVTETAQPVPETVLPEATDEPDSPAPAYPRTGVNYTDGYPVNEPTGTENEVVVSTAEEFLNAIGSDRAIYMMPGVYDLTQAAGYGRETASDCYYWEAINDGFGLVIHDVENLSITGHHAGDTEIVTMPRYANVIGFIDCSKISVRGVTAGHTEGPGHCSGSVLYFDATDDASVAESVLFGCGTFGLELLGCDRFSAKECVMESCSIGGASIRQSRDVALVGCRIAGCGSLAEPVESLLSIVQSERVTFVNGIIEDNTSYLLADCAYARDVRILGSLIQNNEVSRAMIFAQQYSPVVEGCAFSENDSGAWYAKEDGAGESLPAVSMTGAELSEDDLANMQHVQQEASAYELSAELPSAGEMREVHAASVDELLAAIASDTTVYLADGVYDLSEAAGYGVRGGGHYYWFAEFDGPALVINGVTNFHIVGTGADKVSIHATPRYANVVTFMDCENVSVTGAKIGHTQQPGECSGGVLRFERTDHFIVRACGLFGCGTIGVDAYDCSTFTVEDTEIYECSYGAVNLELCTDGTFTNCRIHDCGEPLFQLYECEEITMDGAPVETLLG